MTRKKKIALARKIYATKKWLISEAGKDAEKRFIDCCHVSDAMQHLANGFAECAVARHSSGGMMFAKTSDGMEWSIRYEKIGVRNSKSGKIDKRIKAKWPTDK